MTAQNSSKITKKNTHPIGVHEFVGKLLNDSTHCKRVDSIANAALGLIEAQSCIVHKMGAGLALARDLSKKHATKQIDRLLSNPKFDVHRVSEVWAKHAIGDATQIMAAMDWTDFHADEHTTISINLLTHHGRAIPLLWKTVESSSLKSNRCRHERELLLRLKNCIAPTTKVTILADRGFSSQSFFRFFDEELKFQYLIRTRSNIYVTDSHEEKKRAREWLHPAGRTVILKDIKVTADKYPVSVFVCCQKKDMKEPWYLLSNIQDILPAHLVPLYAKRWSIKPFFRDLKDIRFGVGLSSTHLGTPERRDKMLFIFAMATALTTCLGEAGENIGFARKLKVNTVKTRTHSLFTQGLYYYESFRNFTELEKSCLLESFQEVLGRSSFWTTWLEGL